MTGVSAHMGRAIGVADHPGAATDVVVPDGGAGYVSGERWWDQRKYRCGFLYELFGDIGAMAEFFGRSERQVHRWIEQGATWDQADEIACKLGWLPYAIWPDWVVLPAEAYTDLDREGDQLALQVPTAPACTRSAARGCDAAGRVGSGLPPARVGGEQLALSRA